MTTANKSVLRALARKLILTHTEGVADNSFQKTQAEFATFRNAAIVMELLDESNRLREALIQIKNAGKAADAAGGNPLYAKCERIARFALEEENYGSDK